MDSLFILQYTCFLVTSMSGIALIVSFFQQSDVTEFYRQARWLLLFGVLIYAAHFVLQMTCGLRAQSDEIGTVFNILFYTPASFLISCAIMRLVCGRSHFGRYVRRGMVGCVVTTLTFCIGFIIHGDFENDIIRYVMHSAFFLSMAYDVIGPFREIRRNQKRVVDGTGNDITQYERFVWSSYLLLSITASLLVFAILWRKPLFILGPMLLLSLLIFIMSFIALGFNIAPIEDVIDYDADSMGILIAAHEKQREKQKARQREELERMMEEGNGKEPEKTTDAAPEEKQNEMPEEMLTETPAEENGELPVDSARMQEISDALNRWIADGGFRDTTANIAKLAKLTHVEREELSLFFYRYLDTTFRIWLSDIRFGEAQRMIKAHPEYNNDTISSNCGFSSRSQLYRIFSDRLGMSPREWYESLAK